MDARVDEHLDNVLFVVSLAGVSDLRASAAVTVHAHLGIAIAHRLTINWMMLPE